MRSGAPLVKLRASLTLIGANSMPIDTTPAWVVYAWPPLLWQVNQVQSLPLSHLGTRVLSYGDECQPPSGQTVWGQADDGRNAGVAWDWVEIRDGVVAMSDPLALITNV